MEKSTSRTIRLGIMVITGVVLFTIAVYLIGQKQDMFSNTFRLNVTFNNVGGLQPGNNVRYSGINVGSVMSVSIVNDTTIEVVLRIKDDARKFIKRNALVTIGTDGLMGNMIININPGRGDSPIVENNDRLSSYSRVKTDDILKTLNMTNENAAILTHDLVELVEDIRNGRGTISSLVYDTALSHQLYLSIQNLRSATEKTNRLLGDVQIMASEIDSGRGLAGYLLRDTLTASQLMKTMKELQQASANIQVSTDSLRTFIHRLNTEQGTLNTLISDTTMAKDLKNTIHNLSEGTAKFDENMEALKSSFLTKKYFKNQEKAKAKEENKKDKQ
jgi:phospholipid/cholesterol/gamma-HCH transport system substrate-binding protein